MDSTSSPQQILCRSSQAAQLNTLLDPLVPVPPSIVLHGPANTGKTLVFSSILTSLNVPYAIVPSRECITGRHLLKRTVQACRDSLNSGDYGISPRNVDSRSENLGVLAAQLQSLLEPCSRFYLVFDGIDKQREAPNTLIPALARISEMIPSLTAIFVVQYFPSHLLRQPGVPYISFPAYTQEESIEIVKQEPLPFGTSLSPSFSLQSSAANQDEVFLWSVFCALVWQTLGGGLARDIVSFRNICRKLWPSFTAPIISGEVKPRDIAPLVRRARPLLQSDGGLISKLVGGTNATTALPLSSSSSAPVASTSTPSQSSSTKPATTPSSTLTADRLRSFRTSQSLTHSQQFLLLAAYLCSHNPSRLDSVYFMKMHDRKRKRRNRLTSQAISSTGLKHYKVQRRLLGAQGFVLERLLAVLTAISPAPPPRGSADVLAELATLAALKLVVKAGGPADVTDAQAKWRVNVGWEYIRAVAKGVRFEIEEYIAE